MEKTASADIDYFEAYCRTSGKLSPKTIKDYKWDLLHFERDMRPKPLREVTSTDVTLYMGKLINRGLKPSTLPRKLYALRAFYRVLIDMKGWPTDPTVGVELQDSSEPEVRSVLSREEVQRVINAPAGRLAIRNKAILALYANGLKRAEVPAMDVSDLDLENNRCTISGRRSVPLNPDAVRALRAYETVRRHVNTSEDALFLTVNEDRITPRQAWVVVRDAALRAGVNNNVSPESLRQAFAVHALQDGHDMMELANIMGLDSMNTLQQYAEIARKHAHASEVFTIAGIRDETFDQLDMRRAKHAWQKIISRLDHNDPEGAITTTRTLLEAICKKVLSAAAQPIAKSDNLSGMFKHALAILLPPDADSDRFVRFSRTAASLVESLSEYRNTSGDAHASLTERTIRKYEVQYAVGLASCTATFLVHAYRLYIARGEAERLASANNGEFERFMLSPTERDALLSIVQMAARSSSGENQTMFAAILDRLSPKGRRTKRVRAEAYVALTTNEIELLLNVIPPSPRGSTQFVGATKRLRAKLERELGPESTSSTPAA